MTLIYYTGHPFIDVGVATLTAWANKNDKSIRVPADVTADHLEEVARELAEFYVLLKPVRNYISTIFLNAHFVQPAKTETDRWQYAHETIFAFRSDKPSLEGIACTFFPDKPAVMFAHRQYIPLLNGYEISNFSPWGTSGLPVSGEALLAIHAMPLGCLKCGHLLAFHQLGMAHGRDMNFHLASHALTENLKAIQRIQLDDAQEMPSFGSYYKTRYVDVLIETANRVQRGQGNLRNITGYYFTNYGPSPNLEIVRLDNAVLDFIDVAQQDAPEAWQRCVLANWLRPKGEDQTVIEAGTTQTWRNLLYEALFRLPDYPGAFLRRIAKQRQTWTLIEIFLRKVMLMEKERIETYRQLGDRIAEYMLTYEPGTINFYYRFARADKPWKLYALVRSAAEKVFKSGSATPLLTYDQFISAFEHPGDQFSQWRLGRDLIAMRILEILHQHNIEVDKSELPDDEDLENE